MTTATRSAPFERRSSSQRERHARRRVEARTQRGYPSRTIYNATATGPVTYVRRAAAGSIAAATSTTTGSITNTAGNKLLLAISALIGSTGPPNTPTVSGWTQVGSRINFGINNVNDSQILFFYKDADGSAQTPTIDFGGQTQADGVYICEEISGAASGATAFPQANAGTNGSSGSSGLCTLGALHSANSLCYVLWMVGQNQTIAVGTWTKTTQWGIGGAAWAGAYATNDTTADSTWPTPENYGGLAVEIATT